MGTHGPTYSAVRDGARLERQFDVILAYMLERSRGVRTVEQAHRFGTFSTLSEIEAGTGYPQSSISAQLRHARKEKFGAYGVEKRRRGGDSRGTWEYCAFDPSPRQRSEQLSLGV